MTIVGVQINRLCDECGDIARVEMVTDHDVAAVCDSEACAAAAGVHLRDAVNGVDFRRLAPARLKAVREP